MASGRRKGRIIALQALYSWACNGEPLEDLLDFEWVDQEKKERLGEDGLAFPRIIITGTIGNIEQIDKIIKEHLINWDFDRLKKVDAALLRMSVYSLLYQKEIPPSIVIDEAIDMAKEFGTEDSFKFVNGVLDNIRKSLAL